MDDGGNFFTSHSQSHSATPVAKVCVDGRANEISEMVGGYRGVGSRVEVEMCREGRGRVGQGGIGVEDVEEQVPGFEADHGVVWCVCGQQFNDTRL